MTKTQTKIETKIMTKTKDTYKDKDYDTYTVDRCGASWWRSS